MIDILFDENLSMSEKLLLFIIVGGALVMALTLHEFAHAFAALKNGDRTAQVNGRLSLNPMRHLDPVGFAMLMVMGFGYAKPVPVNPYNFRKKRFGVFTVSVAGIVTNMVLAFLTMGIYVAILKFAALTKVTLFVLSFLWYFVMFNIFLFFFNLLPFFPLDGFNMLTAILKPTNRFLQFMRKYGYYIFILLIGISVIVNMVDVQTVWWEKFDILGLYLDTFSGWIERAFFSFWRLIFRI